MGRRMFYPVDPVILSVIFFRLKLQTKKAAAFPGERSHFVVLSDLCVS